MPDWERAAGDDAAGGRGLLERLRARGLRTGAGPEPVGHDGGGGLEAAVGPVHAGPGGLFRRCVFRVLRNPRDAARGDPALSRAAKRARRRAVLGDAAVLRQATARTEADHRRAAFRASWAEREPEAVATLARVFAVTLAYLDALERGRERGQDGHPRHRRTTGALERVNRALRHKARQVGVFQAARGLVAGRALGIAL